MTTRQDPVREQLLKSAAAGLTEAISALQEHEKTASAQATGLDPAEYAKQASLARAFANLQYCNMVDGLLEGMAQDARDKGEMPYAVDHPWLNSAVKSIPAGLVGAGAGALLGAATHSREGAQLGGMAGYTLGALGGHAMAVKEHHDAATKLEDEGYKMDFVTRHPYLTGAAGNLVAGPLGEIGAAVLHHNTKQDLAKQIKEREG